MPEAKIALIAPNNKCAIDLLISTLANFNSEFIQQQQKNNNNTKLILLMISKSARKDFAEKLRIVENYSVHFFY